MATLQLLVGVASDQVAKLRQSELRKLWVARMNFVLYFPMTIWRVCIKYPFIMKYAEEQMKNIFEFFGTTQNSVRRRVWDVL